MKKVTEESANELAKKLIDCCTGHPGGEVVLAMTAALSSALLSLYEQGDMSPRVLIDLCGGVSVIVMGELLPKKNVH